MGLSYQQKLGPLKQSQLLLTAPRSVYFFLYATEVGNSSERRVGGLSVPSAVSTVQVRIIKADV